MKKKYLIATHGEMAGGLQSSLKVLADKGEQVSVINAYLTDADFTPDLIAFIESISAEEQGVIFTDLFGGSVNQKAVTEVMERQAQNIFIVSNVNLAIILTFLFDLDGKDLTTELIEEAIATCQVQLVKPIDLNEDDSIF